VVDAATNIDDPPAVRCRRWPRHWRGTRIATSLLPTSSTVLTTAVVPLGMTMESSEAEKKAFWDGFADEISSAM
jgi:hypothetical protein